MGATPEVLIWRRVDVIGPDGTEVLGRLDAYSGPDSGWWAWFCAACATVGGPRFRAVDRALRALAEHKRRNIAERLTITMSGPDVIDLRSSGDINELGEIPTRDLALAIRPRLDDPTRLTNGEIHPRYAQWLAEHSQTDSHPLHSYLHQQKNLHRWTDESGHLNQSAVKRALGRSGPDYWLPDGPVPTKARLPRLAQLLDAPLEEIQAVVEQERHIRQEHQAIVSSCRSLPEKLLTYEQIRAGVPCPGCGRPWIGPQNDIDTDRERWAALHGECRAGRNGYTDSPIHCMRCCGVPAPSPAQIAAVLRILRSASSDRTLQSRPTPIPPEAEFGTPAKGGAPPDQTDRKARS